MTYAYECRSCGQGFEFEQSIHDEPLKLCPCEESGELRRVISGGLGVFTSGSDRSPRMAASGPCCGPGGCGHSRP